ncbi:MAG TPA: hypothetical protein VHA33_28430 [Candidatus Angelobacter sp.]|jgi:hypothetical protein|nr:hypothetical protein [Candidatus Angelobacter sp.]
MANQDDEKERQRLAEVYSGMPDGELVNIAAESGSLTDVARRALNEEIDRRGNLESEGIEDESLPADADIVESQDVVVIRKFRDIPEAWMAKGRLDSSGIECWLIDDNMVRLDWFISNFLGGVKLQVKQEDAAIANEVLEQPVPESFDGEGTED